jgi:branched-chain amino acid transport system permease protein
MLQILINSLINGLAIGGVALAFSLVYRPTGVFYLALGGVYSLVPHIALTLIGHGIHWSVACFVAVIVGVFVSCLCELLSHSRLERKKSPTLNHLVSSLGIYIVLVQITVLLWGSATKVFWVEQDLVFRYAGLSFARPQIITGTTLLVTFVALGIWMKKRKLGLQLRGLIYNPKEMQLLGRPVPYLRLLAFGISGGLVAEVALLIANDVGFDPFGGIAVILLGVVAVIIGGRDSFVGPVVGGIILSLVRSMTTWYSPKWQEAVTFLLLGFFLIFLPRGIFSRGSRMEADS